MKAQRKIIVYIATSADGYIARPDGDVEWLNRRPRTVDYGMTEFYRTIDTILWGRKTYDWVLAYYRKKGKKGNRKNGKKDDMFDTKLANYVFSRRPPKRATPGVEFVSEPVKTFAQRLRATPGRVPCAGSRSRSPKTAPPKTAGPKTAGPRTAAKPVMKAKAAPTKAATALRSLLRSGPRSTLCFMGGGVSFYRID